MNSRRLAVYYASSFMMLGIHLVFWPLWLSDRGLQAPEIGLLLASGIASKLVANPLVAHFADRLGQRRLIICILSSLAFVAFLLFPYTDSFATVLALHLVFLALWSPTMPLMESMVMYGVTNQGYDYGRIRLWGSVTFMVAVIAVGYLLTDRSTDLVFMAIAITMGLTVVSALALPDLRPPKSTDKRLTLFAVVQDKRFVLFLLGTALIQSSHAVYYGFGSIHWRNNGITEDWIGILWATGVLAEIILFTYATQVLKFIGPARLIALAGLVGLVRWPLTALTLDLWSLLGLQFLHAMTFGATHIGAMYFIQNRIDPSLSATAQALYSGIVMGGAMSIAAYTSGLFYANHGGDAYFAMGGMAAVGAALVFILRRK